jgi:peptidoglycan/xylan/chitin deacetylase (PgdA/CDA1 family)
MTTKAKATKPKTTTKRPAKPFARWSFREGWLLFDDGYLGPANIAEVVAALNKHRVALKSRQP